MRIKTIIATLLLLVFFLLSFDQIKAACAGTSCSACSGNCGTQTCTFSGSYTSNSCGGVQGSCAVYRCIDYNVPCYGQTCTSDPDTTYWNPEGYTNTVCSNVCDDFCTDNISCVYETTEVLCNCTSDPPAGGGGGGGGGDPEPTADPTTTPTSSIIAGNLHQDINAALSGAYCNQAESSPLYPAGLSLNAVGSTGTHNASFSMVNVGSYQINTTSSGPNYTITLDLTAQTGGTNYVCSCPAPVDPANPYVCRYTGVGSPTAGANFYLKEYDLSNQSWFQVFGGNLFSLGSIASDVPYDFCEADGSCQAALLVPPVGSSNQLASGFAVASTGNNNNLRSSDSSSVYHSYFHLIERLNNVNSYGVNTSLNQLGYEYFYKLAENSLQAIGTGEDLEPLLADWTGATWWQTDEINYVAVDGNVSIDESQGFNLTAGQKLVVFVDGNLTLDDSNPGDTNRKITSVDETSFLAFIVKGNILVTPHVGYELSPSAPSVPTVTVANSNVEGVFVADGTLTIQSKTAIGEVPPDKKFIGAGTFVGWSDINLNRTFNDNSFGPILNNNQAIENFIYRPDLLSNWPTKLKASVSNWREVDPQLITQ